MSRKLRVVFGACLILAFHVNQAFADRIAGVTATTTMGSFFGTNLINTVNGVGLSSLSLDATHASTVPANSWHSGLGVLTGTVTFNLGGLYNVGGFSFWNQNGGGPGANGSSGIQGVQVLTSTDGVTFIGLAGGPTSFAQVPGTGQLPPEIFAFGAVSATHFRFNILSNYGSTAGTAFAEVGFNAVTTPEPSAAVLVLIGLAAIARLRRRVTF